MAKVTGPLMSLSASGSVANTLVFSIWKGRPYVRELVKPSNPQTEAQAAVRSILALVATACKAVLTVNKDTLRVGSAFYARTLATTPTGQSWNSHLNKQAWSYQVAITDGYGALDGTETGYFEAAAESIGMADYSPSFPNGTAFSKGNQLFALAYLDHVVNTSATFADMAAPQEAEVTQFALDVSESVS